MEVTHWGRSCGEEELPGLPLRAGVSPGGRVSLLLVTHDDLGFGRMGHGMYAARTLNLLGDPESIARTFGRHRPFLREPGQAFLLGAKPVAHACRTVNLALLVLNFNWE